MYYLLLAFLSAVLGTIPVFLAKKPIASVVQPVCLCLVNWWFFYGLAISTVYPLFGAVGLMVWLGWIIGAIVASTDTSDWRRGGGDNSVLWAWLFPAGGTLLYVFIFIGTSGMFRASNYASMLSQYGEIENRVWTQDVQPKDPAHMRMGTLENALYRGKAIIGRDGAIGSQFQVNENAATIQKVRNELIVAIPLDYSGYGSWSNTAGAPGYIKVSAEDPHRDPEFIVLPKGKEMRYTPNAWFSYKLERYLRNNGYLNVGLTDWTFEIDDSGQEWYVVTVFKPTIGFSGDKVTGVVISNPSSGEIKFYSLGQVPDWVDRVVPGSLVQQYLRWQGQYSGGWWNTLPWAANANMTEPAENPMIIYGTGDQPEWVTGITSTNNADHSLVGLVYVNSRTGKSVRYQMAGGATPAKIIEGVNENSEVKYKQLHGAAVQLYNVFGLPTAVVPLLNGQHAFQGVAMVPINDFQLVAVGSTAHEAQRAFEKMMSERDQRVAIEAKRDIQHVDGVVARVNSETLQVGTTYYLYLEGIPRLFTSGPGLSSKLVVTRPGDKVRIGFYESEKDVVPISDFDNLTVPLSKSPLQTKLESATTERRLQQEIEEDAQAVLERLKKMDPKELQKLGKQIPK